MTLSHANSHLPVVRDVQPLEAADEESQRAGSPLLSGELPRRTVLDGERLPKTNAERQMAPVVEPASTHARRGNLSAEELFLQNEVGKHLLLTAAQELTLFQELATLKRGLYLHLLAHPHAATFFSVLGSQVRAEEVTYFDVLFSQISDRGAMRLKSRAPLVARERPRFEAAFKAAEKLSDQWKKLFVQRDDPEFEPKFRALQNRSLHSFRPVSLAWKFIERLSDEVVELHAPKKSEREVGAAAQLPAHLAFPGGQGEVQRYFDETQLFRSKIAKIVETVVESNLRYVVRAAFEFRGTNLSIPKIDLFNSGSLGLWRAAHLYDPDRGTRFITYARWLVKAAFQETAGVDHTIIQSRSVHSRFQSYRARVDRAEREHGPLTSHRKIAQALGISEREVARFEEARTAYAVSSLNAPLGDERGVGAQEFGDSIADSRAVPPWRDLDQAFRAETVRKMLTRVLNARELKVIELRFGFDGGGERATLESVSHHFGCTREWVRQIEAKALRKLRGYVALRRLKELATPEPSL